MRKFIKNPYAERLIKNGHWVTVTDGEGDNTKIIEKYFVTPEEIQASIEQRDAILKSKRIQY